MTVSEEIQTQACCCANEMKVTHLSITFQIFYPNFIFINRMCKAKMILLLVVLKQGLAFVMTVGLGALFSPHSNLARSQAANERGLLQIMV